MYQLKKSYIQETINLYLIRLILKIKFSLKNQKKKEKILVKSCDGIGDILIRSKLSQMIIDEYGKENVYFLMQDSYAELGKILGYNVIGYSRKERKNFIYRLKKMNALNNMNLKKFINIEFINDITTGNIFAEEIKGLNDYHKSVKRNNKFYTNSFEKPKEKYILYLIQKMYKEILNKKVNLKEVEPDLKDFFENDNKGIVVQVGSSARNKVCSPKVMAEYIQEINNKNKNKTFTLIGYGDLQFKYSKELENLLPHIKLRNLVNKTNLKEAFDEVGKSELYLGFDSGLYNLAFTLNKPIISIFNSSIQKGFIHERKNAKILVATDKEIEECKIKDSTYSNKAMNSVKSKRVLEAYEELFNE